jgi:hypothetical protein
MKISALDVDLKNQLDRKDNLSLIDLGSYQYSEIEKDYSRFRRCPEKLPEFYRNIYFNPTDFKNKLYNFLEQVYNKYESIRLKTFEELTDEEREEFFFDIYPTEEDCLSEIEFQLKENPFDFPVKPTMLKLALLKYAEFFRKMARDLWRFLSEIHAGIFKNSNYPTIDGYTEDAAVLFLLAYTLDIDDILITKYFGNFDT